MTFSVSCRKQGRADAKLVRAGSGLQLRRRPCPLSIDGVSRQQRDAGGCTSNRVTAPDHTMTLGLATPADHDDDVELVRALADDDRRAPAALWRRYAPTVFNILRRPTVVAVDEQPPALP